MTAVEWTWLGRISDEDVREVAAAELLGAKLVVSKGELDGSCTELRDATAGEDTSAVEGAETGTAGGSGKGVREGIKVSLDEIGLGTVDDSAMRELFALRLPIVEGDRVELPGTDSDAGVREPVPAVPRSARRSVAHWRRTTRHHHHARVGQ